MSVQIDLELLTKQFQQGVTRAVKATDDFARQFNKATSENEKGMRSLANSVDRNTKSMSSSFSAVSVAAGTFLGNLAFDVVIGGLRNATSAVVNFGQASLGAAIDGEETESKFATIFRSISTEAQSTADELSKSFGLGSVEARRLLGDTGDLLTGFGFTQEGALGLSKQVQELAVDLASFTNFSGGAEGASAALTKALLGERESVKALGISIQEKDVQDQIAINNARGLTFETERQAKAQATLDIAIRQSGNAIGDYARTSNSAANQQRLFTTRINDLQLAVGKGLVPAFNVGLVEVNKFLTSIDPNTLTRFVSDGVIVLIQGLEVLVDNINPVINAFRALGDGALLVFNAIRTAFNVLNVAVAGFVDSFIGDIKQLIDFLPDAIVPDSWEESINNFKEASSETLEEVKTDTGNSVNEMLKNFDDLSRGYEDSISEESLNKIRDILARTRTEVRKATEEAISAPNNGQQNNTQQDDGQEQLRLQAQRELNAKLLELERAKNNELAIINATQTETRQNLNLQELQQLQELEQQKLQIIRDANLQKAKEEEDVNKRLLAIRQVNTKFEVDQRALTVKQEQELSKRKEEQNKERETNLRSSLGRIASLSQSSNKTLATIGRAAAITTATQDGIVAVQKALASAPPPFNFAIAGLVGAATAANVARLSGIGNFENGGIIPGTSTTGDRITANVNSGEMILNRRQQTELFNQANGNSSSSNMSGDTIRNIVQEVVSSMNVTLVADDNEIARSVSRGVNNGVVIGAS